MDKIAIFNFAPMAREETFVRQSYLSGKCSIGAKFEVMT